MESITYEEAEVLDLKEAGWELDENGFWYHPHHNKSGGYTTEHAQEILILEKRLIEREAEISRLSNTVKALTETLKNQRWRDGEAGVTYLITSDPPFLFEPTRVSNFNELTEILSVVFEELEDKEKEVGTLVYSLVSKKFDKVKFPDGNEVDITEYFINTLFKWNGEKWVNVFGGVRNVLRDQHVSNKENDQEKEVNEKTERDTG